MIPRAYENVAAMLSRHHKLLLVRDGDCGAGRSDQVPYVSVGTTVYLALPPGEQTAEPSPSAMKVVLRLRCDASEGREFNELVMAGTAAAVDIGDEEASILERLGEVARAQQEVARLAPMSVLKVRLWLACTTSDLRSGDAARTDFAWVPVGGREAPLQAE